MFTGIILETGVVARASQSALAIRAGRALLRKLAAGVSIAVDGVCLTVTKKDAVSFYADIMEETRGRTALSALSRGARVNLELPATAHSFLAGHIVQGHVDGTAILARAVKKNNSRILKFSIAPALSKYIVGKGSVAVNGISLTVIDAGRNFFTVGIVPRTWKATTLRQLSKGDRVNIEVDVLAKYAQKILKSYEVTPHRISHKV